MTDTDKDILIKNGHIIDPLRHIDENASLIVSAGKILWFGRKGDTVPAGDYKLVDAEGLIVCPGFIDIHCHLREPGNEEKETVATGTRAAARGGFTTICCMPNTIPPLDNAAGINNIKSIILNNAAIGVIPVGCVSQERKGNVITNMDEMAATGIAGFSDDGSTVVSENVMKEALQRSIRLDLPIIDHCEDPTVSGKWDINAGEVSKRLLLRSMPSGSEESIIERDLALNRKIGGRLHLAHVSTADSVFLIRKAKQAGIRVTAEVTPHHLTMTEERVLISGTNAKVSPPLRTRKDIEALVEGLMDNTLDAIATDHAPHTTADKELPFAQASFGISGFETALGSLTKLMHDYKLTFNLVIEKLTVKPAEIISKSFGRTPVLAIGSPADVTVLDLEREWRVDPSEFVSKGKNTPLAGEMLRGKVMLTIYRGKTVYRDNEYCN